MATAAVRLTSLGQMGTSKGDTQPPQSSFIGRTAAMWRPHRRARLEGTATAPQARDWAVVESGTFPMMAEYWVRHDRVFAAAACAGSPPSIVTPPSIRRKPFIACGAFRRDPLQQSARGGAAAGQVSVAARPGPGTNQLRDA